MNREDFPSIIIDSTSDVLRIILLKTQDDYIVNKTTEKSHLHNVMVLIDDILYQNNQNINNVKNIGVIVGPGSFTGIRIGVATANAVAAVNNAKIVEITSLESAVFDMNNVLALLDCKNDNYYGYLKTTSSDNIYLAVSVSELSNYKVQHFYIQTTDDKLIVKTFISKLMERKVVKKAEPFYIKKSSAEQLK